MDVDYDLIHYKTHHSFLKTKLKEIKIVLETQYIKFLYVSNVKNVNYVEEIGKKWWVKFQVNNSPCVYGRGLVLQ